MKKSLLNNENIKKLNIVKIYLFYDQPILYKCSSDDGINYLVILIGENESLEEWIYLQISAQRELQLLNNELSILNAMRYPEAKIIYKYDIKQNGDFEVYEILPSRLSSEQLPDSDLYLGRCLKKDAGESGVVKA